MGSLRLGRSTEDDVVEHFAASPQGERVADEGKILGYDCTPAGAECSTEVLLVGGSVRGFTTTDRRFTTASGTSVGASAREAVQREGLNVSGRCLTVPSSWGLELLVEGGSVRRLTLGTSPAAYRCIEPDVASSCDDVDQNGFTFAEIRTRGATCDEVESIIETGGVGAHGFQPDYDGDWTCELRSDGSSYSCERHASDGSVIGEASFRVGG